MLHRITPKRADCQSFLKVQSHTRPRASHPLRWSGSTLLRRLAHRTGEGVTYFESSRAVSTQRPLMMRLFGILSALAT